MKTTQTSRAGSRRHNYDETTRVHHQRDRALEEKQAIARGIVENSQATGASGWRALDHIVTDMEQLK